MDCAVESSIRQDILARFERLLDEALVEESLPVLESESGIDGADLHAVWARLTAVTQEVKLQGRVFKQLEEAVSPLAELVTAQSETQERALVEIRALTRSHVREAEQEAEQRARQTAVAVLLDVRDRLERGLNTCESTVQEFQTTLRAGWWDRLWGRDPFKAVTPALQALQDGYRLGLARMDDALAGWQIRSTDCCGRPFDSRSMQAVEVVASATAPDGTVLDVYRTGFEGPDGMVRLAQVKVSRQPKEGR